MNMNDSKHLHHDSMHHMDMPSHQKDMSNMTMSSTHEHMNHMHMSDDPGMANMDMADLQRRFWLSFALMIPIIFLSPFMGHNLPFTLHFSGSQWLATFFAIMLYIIGSKPFFDGAKSEIKSKKPAMMSLVSMGLIVTFWYSLYAIIANQFWSHTTIMDFLWEFATLTVIMLLGHRIEMSATMKAGDASAKLQALLPQIAHVRHGDMLMDMPVSTLKTDMIVQVLAGEAFPADGVIINGNSQVDESLMTGESRLIDKKLNDTVVGGTINGSGSLDVKLTHVGASSFLGQLQHTLSASQESKSQVETVADRVASYLFWVALILSILSFFIWLAISGISTATNIAVTVLVIACPHALGLAVPLVIQRTKAIAAAQGILVKNRKALTNTTNMKYVLMDKTGTLTTGKFNVTRLMTYDNTDEATALSIMAALDEQSTHPLAQSIVLYATQQQAPKSYAVHVSNIAGFGVSGMVDDVHYLLVSQRYLVEHDISFVPLETDGTISYLLKHDHVIAAIAQGDAIKDSAPDFVHALINNGLQPVLVTGDNDKTAQHVANALGIKIVHAQVSPQEKINLVTDYQKQGHLMMIGDGINDAPALAKADLSIAIGAGTQVAQASADAVLISNQLPKIIDFLRLVHASNQKQHQNLWWGAGYNIIAMPLAAGILAPIGVMLNPMIGAIFMSLSTVIVALNAMTLKS